MRLLLEGDGVLERLRGVTDLHILADGFQRLLDVLYQFLALRLTPILLLNNSLLLIEFLRVLLRLELLRLVDQFLLRRVARRRLQLGLHGVVRQTNRVNRLFLPRRYQHWLLDL